MTVAAVVAAVVGVLAIAVGAWALRPTSAPAPVETLTAAAPETTASAEASPSVEVPSVEGMSVEEARVVLGAAGFGVTVVESAESVDAAGKVSVIAQQPSPGTLAAAGTEVVLTVPVVRAPAPAAAKKKAPSATRKFVVVIDPGHQARSDSRPEPIGPGASQTKARVTGGATGTETGIPEYEIVLQISMNLKRRLEAEGVTVVMTRTVNDVNLSNSERAAIANKARADLFVRIHGDGSPDAKMAGISTLYPGVNSWTKPIAAPSKEAAAAVQRAVIASTGAVDRGAKPRTDLSGFNWAKVPAVLVESGFLSNPVEDKLLSSPHYQDKVAEGIANGVLSYLRGNGGTP